MSRRGVLVKGTSSAIGCGGIKRVLVAVARQSGSKCRFLSRRAKLGRPRSCAKPTYLTAKGTKKFSLRIRGRVKPGRYRFTARAFDGAGNFEPLRYAKARLR